eukprot:1351089-Ditylum_brightwellii.AAC.1
MQQQHRPGPAISKDLCHCKDKQCKCNTPQLILALCPSAWAGNLQPWSNFPVPQDTPILQPTYCNPTTYVHHCTSIAFDQT